MIFAFAGSSTKYVVLFITVFVLTLFVIFANDRKNKQQEQHHNRHDNNEDEDNDDTEKENLLISAALLGTALNKKPPKKKKENNWETHCEFCGELLEDCRCEHRRESRRDTGLWDCDDEEDDF